MQYVARVTANPIDPGAPLITEHEERIRRAVRYAIQSSHTGDGRIDCQHVFDLLAYLRPEAQAIVEDEVGSALAELIASI
jgi:hypothetical protein